MNVVTFPALNLQFEFSKVAFSILGLPVYKYAVCIVIGIVVALILAKLSKEKFGIDFQDVLICAIIGIIFGTIGARLYYVLFNLDYYSKNILEIFDLQSGGLAIYGGLILGGLAIWFYCKKKKIDYLDFFDYIVPFVALAQCFGRWGNFFNVEAYGVETPFFLRMGITTIQGYMEVHPVFLYESIANLVIFVLLKIAQKQRKFKGQIFVYYGALYSGVRFFLETLRTDSLMIFNYRASQLLSALILVLSVLYLYYRKKVQKPANENETENK